MSRFVFANRISALITATLSTTDVNVQLEAGAGALLPVLNADEIIRATLIAPDGTSEIVNGLTIIGDVVSLQRGQEGTPAGTFPSGSRFEMRLTAGVADNFLQRSGGVMTGPLDMANNEIQRAKFTGATVFNSIHVTLIRSAAIPPDVPFNGPLENSINIPPNTNPDYENRRPRYLGRPITNAQMFDNIIFDWSGNLNQLPTHLRLCDGSQGTPDVRGLFIRGWDATFAPGSFGGHAEFTTQPSGAHNHGGFTADLALTIAQMPAHAHSVPQVGGTGGTEGSDGFLGPNNKLTSSQGGGQPHRHGIAAEPAHIHTIVDPLPPFFAVAKVMFRV